MQPGRPPRPDRPVRPILLVRLPPGMHQHQLPTSSTSTLNGAGPSGSAPMFAMPTTRLNFRPDQLATRPPIPRQVPNQATRPQSSLLQTQIHASFAQQMQSAGVRSLVPASLARPVSSLFIRSTSSQAASTSRPLTAANLLRSPQLPRQTMTMLPAVASTSAGTGSLPGAKDFPPCTSYSVVPASVTGPATAVSATAIVPRRYPMKQPNMLKIVQERRAATKRKIDELISGTDHEHPTWERQPDHLPLCPICCEVYEEAHVTKCGHTYCYECICQAIDFKPNCPNCNSVITKEELVPNFVIAQVIASQKANKQAKTETVEVEKQGDNVLKDMDVCKFITTRSNGLNLSDVNLMLMLLERRREILTAESREQQRQLLLEFLSQLHKIKQTEKLTLERQVNLLERDIKMIKESASTNEASKESSAVPVSAKVTPSTSLRGFNTNVPHNDILSSSMAAKKKRIHRHFDELVQIYMDTRSALLFDDPPQDEDDNSSLVTDDYTVDLNDDSLNEFATTLSKISRYHTLKPLATFSYSADLLANSNIVSSIEFDKDNEFFAIAGVTRKIKLFEYANVLGSTVDIHCPSSELSCAAKISCISWSGYFKNKLASSDYDGSVILWDTAVGNKISTLNEHERRVWSVDWSHGDPRLFASGSDDTKVKLWSLEQEKSVLTVESNANVCCVKFCPENAFHIAFGSADHCIHYYDFRHVKRPMGILEGHKKAVSYVKFASSMELVSASTDSNLKLWDLATFEEVHSFRGHINEKNFVGLATDGDYIACGSENNSVYVYYKKLPRPLFAYRFENHRSMLYPAVAEESSEFVSAVAWKKGSPVVVAANSQGSIKVLEMQV